MIIGIDADFVASGVATLNQESKRIEMTNLTFVELLLYVRKHKDDIACVYLEAGWLNLKASWHAASNMSVAAKIGRSVGLNHATGILLQQCIEAEQIKVVLVKPTKSKLDAGQFAKLTGIKTRTNSETRDAAMLVFGR